MSATRAHSGHPDAARAAKEVVAGKPGRAARWWLGWVSLVAFALFLIDTVIVLQGTVRTSFDIPVERFLQTFPWGPLTYIMTLTNVTSGLPQELMGVAAVVVLFIYERRAGFLMALGSIASGIDGILKVSIARNRPTADIVTILQHSNGYSYPSGHAVFFTWLAFMLAVSLAPRLSRRGRVGLWAGAAMLIFLACAGRVWAGAHWPSDVIGGFLLALSWSAFVLWLPERWLPSPSWKWIPWRHSEGQ